MKRFMKKGQTMVEYIIIIALVAIALIAVFKFFGRGVGEKIAGATDKISSTEGANARAEYQKIGDETIRDLK